MHKKGNEKELTYFFIMKYGQPLCLKMFLFVPFCGYFSLFVALHSNFASA